MGSEQNDLFDRVLNDALAAYASPEPRPGLEQRVLNRIYAERVRRGFPFSRWAFPAAVLACLVVAIAVRNERTPSPRPPEMVRTAINPPPAPAPAEPARSRRRVRTRTALATAPKQPEFPTAVPLTRQERTLLAVVRTAPELLQSLGAEPATEIEPLRIDAIQLQPLRITDGAK